MEEQECRGANWREVWAAWERAQHDIGIYKARIIPFCIDLAAATQGFEIENEAAQKVLRSSKDRHACGGKQKKAHTESKNSVSLMCGTLEVMSPWTTCDGDFMTLESWLLSGVDMC